jgi:hypothetical protein
MKLKWSLRIGSTILVFLAVLTLPSYSGLRSGALKIQRVELGGTQAANTVAFFEEFALVAPHWPSGEIEAETVTPGVLAALDNNNLYIINTKSPKDEPIAVSLGACHYPTAVVCDGKNAFVRGTAFTETGEPYEVIACVQLRLGEDGKPAVTRTVVVEIPGINEQTTTSEAPTDMVLGLDGKYLLFTNGVSVFTYDPDEGYVYRVDIFSAKDYGPSSYISFAGFDETTRTLVVSHNIIEDLDGKSIHRTVLRFYTLETSGALSSLKIIESGEFPEGAYLSSESEVAIAGDAEGNPQFAYLGLSDGSIGQVELRGEPFEGNLFGHVKQIGQFSALAQGESEAGPRIAKLDPSGQRIWVFNPGSVPLGIRRPLFGRRGRSSIRRPLFIRSQEAAALLSAEFNGKRTKLLQATVLTDLVGEGDSISGLVLPDGSGALLSSRSGRVLEIGITSGTRDAEVELLGELGPVDYFTFAQERIIGLSSAYEQEGDSGELVMSPGSLVVATRKEGKNSSVALSIAQMLSPSAPPLASRVTSIRRPCNLGR